MDFQPRRWYWGLIPLAALWLLAGYLNNDRIQADLTRRAAEQALKTTQPWATVTFAGRDATLTGVAPTPEAKPAAVAAVASVHGVRLVRDGATVLAEQKPWRWTAVRDGSKVTLGGFAPSEEWKARFAGEVRTAIPGATVTDETRVARGAPSVFAAATGYALAQLARLPDGKAELVDSVLSLTGSAPSHEAYAAARGAAPPAGVSGQVQVALPVAKPYLWQAAKQDGTITLSGNAPSAEVKTALAALAARAGEGIRVVDGTVLSAGAPAGFEAMASAALGHLAGLRSGVAAIADSAFSLSGAAPTYEAFQRIAQAAANLPAGFTMARSEIAPPIISPYLWAANRDGATITLQGNIPSEEVRAANLAAARAVPGITTVTDRQLLNAGAPQGFAAMTAEAIAQIGRLAGGAAALSGSSFAIRGEAPSIAARDEAARRAATLPAGFTLERQDISAARISPYVWSASRDGAIITLLGNVPSEEVRAANVAAARAVPGITTVLDRQQLNAGAPQGLAGMTAEAIAQVGRLARGTAALSDTTFVISGDAPSVAVRDEAIRRASALPAGFRLDRQEITALPVSPYVWSATRDGAAVTLNGFVPDEATRTALLAAARAAVPGASVEDRQALGVGAPADFRSAAAFAIAQLGRLDKAETRLTGSALSISGRTASLSARNAAVAALATVPSGYAIARQDINAPRIAPYLWSATRAGDRVTLAGHVPDDATKAALASAAAAPGVTVEDRQDLGLGAPEGFGEMAASALRQLLRLETGEASLANSALSLTGRAGSIGVRDEIVASLQRLPAGYALGRLDLTAPEPPLHRRRLHHHLLHPAAGRSGRPAASPPPPAPAPAAAAPPEPVVSVPPPPPPPEPVVTVPLPPPPPVAVVAPPPPAPQPVPPPPPVAAVAPPPPPPQPAPPPSPPVAAVTPPPPPPVAPPAPAAAPVTPPPAPEVDACQRRLSALLRDPILFDTAEATIRPASYLLLGRLAEAAKSCPTRTIEIGAHTDAEGTPERNQALSDRRAQAVVEFLVREGVAPASLRAVGYGQTRPIAPNDTPENRQKNRRVEFTVK